MKLTKASFASIFYTILIFAVVSGFVPIRFQKKWRQFSTAVSNDRRITRHDSKTELTAVIEINENFDDIVDSPTPVFVEFYANWCGQCKVRSANIDIYLL